MKFLIRVLVFFIIMISDTLSVINDYYLFVIKIVFFNELIKLLFIFIIIISLIFEL